MENFGKEFKNERPGQETMDELVRRESKKLKPAEREAFEKEWKEIQAVEVPDVGFVINQVRAWAKDAALAGAITVSADMIETARKTGKQDDLAKIRTMVDEALRVGEPEGRGGLVYVGEDHHDFWRVDHSRTKVRTGFSRLDMCLDGGVQFGEVFYILAPPKGAKSAFLMNVALNVSRRRQGVAFFSYEMRQRPIVMRMDRNLTGFTKHALRDDPDKVKKAMEGMRGFGAGEIWIQEFSARKQGVEEGARIVERRRGMGHEINLIVFDYLNIMAPHKAERERRLELPAISREMAAVAKELDVAIWSGALVNRKAVNKERIAKTDIAEAFEVIAVADGMVAICAPKELLEHKQRRLFLAALREEEDERDVGLYHVDLDLMRFRELKEFGRKPEDVGKEGEDVDYKLRKT